MSDVAATAAVTAQSAQATSQSPGLGRSMWSKGSFSFKDLLDIVNPLQHLPVVGSIYRYVTGDEPAIGTRIVGDALYGGPIGFGVSVASNALLTNSDGKDLGERMLADVFGSHDHDSDPTVGTPKVATAQGGQAGQQAAAEPMPEWMLTAGTPDGQPRTPVPANQRAANQSAAARIASATRPTKPMGYVPSAGRSIAAASVPMSAATAAAAQQSVPVAVAQPSAAEQAVPVMAADAQAVPMNQLFRSAPAPAKTPEQSFADQTAAFQHQISQGRGTNGAVLSNRPVPLQLTSNLLPVMPAGGHLSLGAGVAAEAGQTASPATASPSPATGQAQAGTPIAGKAPDQSAIAQKMIDALNKYQVLKKQEDQQDNADKADQAKVDLSL